MVFQPWVSSSHKPRVLAHTDHSAAPSKPTPIDDPRTNNDDQPRQKPKKKPAKHQAVFSLDFETWQQLCKAYEVRDPMIAHRVDEQAAEMGARGWYN